MTWLIKAPFKQVLYMKAAFNIMRQLLKAALLYNEEKLMKAAFKFL
jgi:hypothetical protein